MASKIVPMESMAQDRKEQFPGRNVKGRSPQSASNPIRRYDGRANEKKVVEQ